MNKAISLAAILALSAASNEFADLELINLHLEQSRPHRPTFSPLVHDVAHDDEQMIRLQPEIFKPHYRTFTPLAADDNDDEFVYASALRLDDNDDQYFVAPGLVADDEFYVEQADNELNFFKKIGSGLKKAGQFVVSHPQIITTAAKFLDDNDDEFFVDDELFDYDDELYADDDEFVYASPLRADDNDDEFFVDEQADHELNFFKKIGNGLKKAGQFVVSHPQIITTAAKFLDDNDDEFFAQDAAQMKKAQRQIRVSNEALKAQVDRKNGTQDSLLNLGSLLKEGKKVQLPKRPQPAKIQEVQDNMNFLDDFQDNNLSIKDKLKGAANWIGDHPQVITEAAKTYKTLRGKK